LAEVREKNEKIGEQQETSEQQTLLPCRSGVSFGG